MPFTGIASSRRFSEPSRFVIAGADAHPYRLSLSAIDDRVDRLHALVQRLFHDEHSIRLGRRFDPRPRVRHCDGRARTACREFPRISAPGGCRGQRAACPGQCLLGCGPAGRGSSPAPNEARPWFPVLPFALPLCGRMPRAACARRGRRWPPLSASSARTGATRGWLALPRRSATPRSSRSSRARFWPGPGIRSRTSPSCSIPPSRSSAAASTNSPAARERAARTTTCAASIASSFEFTSIDFVIERSGKVWRQYYDSGELVILETEGPRVVFELREFATPHRGHCGTVLGWSERAAELSGVADVSGTHSELPRSRRQPLHLSDRLEVNAGGAAMNARAPDHAERCRTLASQATSATLSTIARDPSGFPYGSLVIVAIDALGRPLLLLSELAEHTGNLRCTPKLRCCSPSRSAVMTSRSPWDA